MTTVPKVSMRRTLPPSGAVIRSGANRPFAATLDRMSVAELVVLFVAGIGGGLCGSVAGVGSLAPHPPLLPPGPAPGPANVTNTVALVFSSVGSVSASRPELRGQRSRVRELAIAGIIGGIVGAALLLVTPADSFEKLVPWLIGLASVAILI